jgi:TonB family protein
MSAALSFRTGAFAWADSPDDAARFRRIQQRVMAVSLLVCLAMPWLPVPKIERTELQPLPPPIAKLLLERDLDKPAPKPPPQPEPKAQAKAEPAPADKSAPKPVPQVKPDQREASVAEARNPVPNKPPGEALESARRRAQGVGLLAMKDQLAQIAHAPVAVQIQQDIKPGPGIGTGSGPGVGAGTEQGIPVRALITSNATNGSGGINTAAYSRDTGGGGLAGRGTTLVEGSIGGGGGGGPGGGAGGGKGLRGDGAGGTGTGAGKGGTLAKSGSGKASRSIEEIRLVFERHKGAIYALYNRALRDEPGLQGKVVLELKIAPSGQVADCRIISTELKAAELEAKLLARIRQFDFGAKDVETMVVSWPVDFLPS